MLSAWESLHYATLELVRSTPIKHRLVSAYRRHLAALPTEQLPAEVRQPFEHLMAALQGVPPLRGEDAVSASVRKMSNQEADDCSTQIVEIYGVTCRALLNTSRPSAAVVQLHSVHREVDHDAQGDAECYVEQSLLAQV
jgi:hypothetical protein